MGNVVCFGKWFCCAHVFAVRLNWAMGMLAAITIAIALIVDFLFLPPLLIRFEKWLSKMRGNDAKPEKASALAG